MCRILELIGFLVKLALKMVVAVFLGTVVLLFKSVE